MAMHGLMLRAAGQARLLGSCPAGSLLLLLGPPLGTLERFLDER